MARHGYEFDDYDRLVVAGFDVKHVGPPRQERSSVEVLDAEGRRPSRLPIAAGFVISLVVHALLLPLLVYMLTSSGVVSAMQDRFAREDVAEPPTKHDEPPPVELGIDASTPATLTWIGYDEYEEHTAHPAEVEQAAFTQDPAAPGRPADASGAGEAVTNPSPPGAPATAQEPPLEPNVDEDAVAPERAAARMTPLADADLDEVQAWLERLSLGSAREQTPPREESKSKSAAEPETTSEVVAAPYDPLAALLEQLVQQGAAGTAPDASTPPDPAEPAPAGEGESRPGERSDKESDPTSLIEIEVRELGKPIARPGIEIKPQRPRITHLISLTASPSNPLVIVKFGADGRPREAEILESSNDSRVDHAIHTSLYRWRAKGAKIAALGPDETVDVQIRILLGRR